MPVNWQVSGHIWRQLRFFQVLSDVVVGRCLRRRASSRRAWLPGAVVTAVAHRHDVHPNLLHHWRRQAKRALEGGRGLEVPAGCRDAVGAAGVDGGRVDRDRTWLSVRVRVDAAVDEAALGRVLRALGAGR